MKYLLPVVFVLVVALVWWLRRRTRRTPGAHQEVPRTEIARTASHFEAGVAADVMLEAIVERLVTMRPPGRPPRRYVVVHRDHRSVEIADRLVEARGTGPLLTLLVEVDPSGTGCRGRMEFLEVTPLDRILDRLAELARTRDEILRTVSAQDPSATFRDELLPFLDEQDATVATEPTEATEATEATEPTEPMEPTKPTEPTEATEAAAAPPTRRSPDGPTPPPVA